MDQREIKFRAWNTSTKKMVDLKAITPFALATGLNLDGVFIPFTEEMKIMQCTGLKDQNGKEIYEGDVLHVLYQDEVGFMGDDSEYVSEVYYDLESAMFAIKRPIGLDTLETNFGKSIRVIGNIFETPEIINP